MTTDNPKVAIVALLYLNYFQASFLNGTSKAKFKAMRKF